MAAPAMTSNAAGNVLNAFNLVGGGTTTVNLDLSTKFEGEFQIAITFGASATAGVQVQCFRLFGGLSPATPDTIGQPTFTISQVVSTTQRGSFSLKSGWWQIKLTNLDGTNAVTATITSETVDTVS